MEKIYMKKDILNLISQVDDIKEGFHVSGGNGLPSRYVIHDDERFLVWRQELQLELQNIYDATKDQFIWDTLVQLKQGFNGWRDEKDFNELRGAILAIAKNVDKYYLQDALEEENVLEKEIKIFISHSSLDVEFVSDLVELLEDIGIRREQMFCSSVPGYGIPLGEDIYEYLRKEFQNYNLHVIFVLSENYYNSVASMNEMGAAWVLQYKYTTILLPGFDFPQIKGAINPRIIGLKLDAEEDIVKEKLSELKNTIVEEFHLSQMSDIRWEKKRDNYLKNINKEIVHKVKISDAAIELLRGASADPKGAIMRINTLSGLTIAAGGENYVQSQEGRETEKWEKALRDLLDNNLIKMQGKKGELFVVTQEGYDFIDGLV